MTWTPLQFLQVNRTGIDPDGIDHGGFHEGGVRIEGRQSAMRGCGFVDSAGTLKIPGGNAVRIATEWQFRQDLLGDLSGLLLLISAPIEVGQQDLQVGPVRVLLECRAQLSDCLGVEFPVSVHASERAARESHLVRLEPIALPDEASKLLLNGGVGRIGFEGPFHVPDAGIQVAFVLSDNRHADMGNEVVGDRREHALEQVGRVSIALGFQVGLAEQAVGVQVFGVGFEDVTGVCDGLIELLALDEVVDLLDIGAQSYVGQIVTLCNSMPHLDRLRKRDCDGMP